MNLPTEIKNLADMHTHSRYSHDSECDIEDMCLEQIRKGTRIFAVTDHCDVYDCDNYDVITPIKKSNEEAKKLSEKYEGECKVLSGVEISESFWRPEVKTDFDCDVVIGSVHCVRYKELTCAYSKIDFSKLDENEIYAYLKAFFTDYEDLFDYCDFDILAHLTCPFRYISGKYSRKVDISYFDREISDILTKTINAGKSLEINTSSFVLLKDFMPCREIVERYYSMGGRLVTLGSDAHVSKNASVNFSKAVDMLRKTGFDSVCFYENRKLAKIKI